VYVGKRKKGMGVVEQVGWQVGRMDRGTGGVVRVVRWSVGGRVCAGFKVQRGWQQSRGRGRSKRQEQEQEHGRYR
jgi:hypothetical protein